MARSSKTVLMRKRNYRGWEGGRLGCKGSTMVMVRCQHSAALCVPASSRLAVGTLAYHLTCAYACSMAATHLQCPVKADANHARYPACLDIITALGCRPGICVLTTHCAPLAVLLVGIHARVLCSRYLSVTALPVCGRPASAGRCGPDLWASLDILGHILSRLRSILTQCSRRPEAPRPL